MRNGNRHKKGALEGLPLHLIIIIIIAAAVLGVVYVWLNQASEGKAPIKKVEVSPTEISVAAPQEGQPATGEAEIQIWVYDTEGNEVDGFVVTISGAVDHEITKKMNSGDKVSVPVKVPPGESTATVHIRVEKGGGMGSAETTVLVYVQR
ncbi:MAG: hypothetical protein J7L88_05730 [Thermoplasmata archaeon]|nr:hypothetical protein [Thermoplasmata archaeon]